METGATNYTLWRLCKGNSIAEARVCSAGLGQLWQLSVDGDVVIGCTFTIGTGPDQVGPLSFAAREELQARGWTTQC